MLKRPATDDPAGVVYVDEGSGPVVLVVHGGQSDESASVLPGARPLAVLPGQGHGANERDPTEVARLVGDYVGSLWSAGMSDRVRAAVLVAPGRCEVQGFPRSRLEDGAALLRMEMSGICYLTWASWM